MSDLDSAYRGADLGPKTTSFQEWARRLTAHAGDGHLDHELEHWRGIEIPRLPVDGSGENTVGASETLSVELDSDATRALLRTVPAVHRTQINDVLLAALSRVLAGWTGHDRVAVAMEGHGREAIFDEVDLSRTVGWFTTLFPVSLKIPQESGWPDVIKAVKRQLRAVPGRGLGYGALRYLRGALAGAPLPELSFNYLGQFDPSAGDDGGLFGADLPVIGEDQAPSGRRQWLLEVVGSVHSGQIGFSWTYCPAIHREQTVRRLADAFNTALREIAEEASTR